MSIGPGTPGAVMEALADGFACGQVGIIFITIDDGDGNNLVGPTTANIVQLECSDDNSANYRYLGVYPAEDAVINWEGENLAGTLVVASEPIFVSTTTPAVAPSPSGGPCQPWITADDIADCCPGFTGGTDTAALEAFAPFASDILYELTGEVYSGECGPITVRPQGNGECSCFTSVLSGWSWDRLSNRWAYGSRSCGCRPVSEVLLAGWPREVTEVRIDGAALSPSEYRLDGFKLVRMRDPAEPDVRLLWPGCQIHDLDDTEEGTFAVDYTYGLDPPHGAAEAAAALACQLWAACNPDDLGEGECELPSNVRQVARAGLTVEFGNLVGEALRVGNTGVPAIDLFLAAHGADVDEGQPSVWSPDIDPYPRRVAALGT